MTLGDALEIIYRRCQRLIVPELRPSQYAYFETLGTAVDSRRAWLDVGCGRRLVPDWLINADSVESTLVGRVNWLVGADLDLDSLRERPNLRDKVQASGSNLPFRRETFDVVSANMVMEHVAEPRRMLEELQRVLRPGGLFAFHTPNCRFWAIRLAGAMPRRVKLMAIALLEGRAEEDVFPTHYRFNDVRDITSLAEAAGFEVVQLETVSSSPVTARLGPVAILELCWIRVLRASALKGRRSNIIGVLRSKR